MPLPSAVTKGRALSNSPGKLKAETLRTFTTKAEPGEPSPSQGWSVGTVGRI